MSIDTGVITLVQEERFQLMNEAGVRHLYVLAADARIEIGNLERLQRSGAYVRVQYRDAPHVIARVAQGLRVVT